MTAAQEALITLAKSGYVHTYPIADDNQKRIHAECVELERNGALSKIADGQDHCIFSLPRSQQQ